MGQARDQPRRGDRGLSGRGWAGVDSFVSLYATQTEVGSEFGRRVQADGLKAALEWRRAQFQT